MCGTQQCASGEVCCETGLMGGTCTAANACMGVALACTSKSDCPQGDVCCGMLMGRMGSSSCQATCSGQQLCSGQADCPQGDRCLMTGPVGICVAGGRDGGAPRDAGLPD
jgi:hypothetical protein